MKFGNTIHRTKGILDYTHTDIWGLSKNASLREKYYFVSFVDDYYMRNLVYTWSPKYLCREEKENGVVDR